jgi:hypothetical protein
MPDDHRCTYDFKADQKKFLKAENPVCAIDRMKDRI